MGHRVLANDRVHLWILQHAIENHVRSSSGNDLLTRLKKQLDLPTELASHRSEHTSRTQKGGGMEIVATGVHDIRMNGSIRHVILLINRQSIHIGTQSDHRMG